MKWRSVPPREFYGWWRTFFTVLPSRCLRSTNCHFLAVPSCVKSSFAALESFLCICLIFGILSLCTSAHLTVLPPFNPALNLTFSLLPITSSHPHASASDSIFDFWRYINIWLTLIDIWHWHCLHIHACRATCRVCSSSKCPELQLDFYSRLLLTLQQTVQLMIA